MTNDMRSTADVHARWMDQRNRWQESDAYRDEWYASQCGACRWWVPLSGALGLDYGGCTNARSAFDGRIRFEHDGCDEFQPADDGWGEPDSP